MLRPIFTTLHHEGFDLPSLDWEGELPLVEKATDLCQSITRERVAQNQRRVRTDDRFEEAAAGLHKYIYLLGFMRRILSKRSSSHGFGPTSSPTSSRQAPEPVTEKSGHGSP